MAPSSSDSPKDPRVLDTLRDDISRIGADLRRSGLKQSVVGTLTDLESFYLGTHTKERLAGMGRVRRWLFLAFWLLKSLFLKLTPARRILFALSLILMVSRIGITVGGDVTISTNWPILGFLLLLLVLMLELKDKLLARDELEAGRSVQVALMPERRQSVPGWDLWLYSEPANDVGGDLVDCLQIAPRRFGVALGDVAGKALPAALLMAKLQATLRALVPQFDSLSDLGAAVNHIIQRDGLPNRFATLVYLEIASESDAVQVLNAGHMPPLVVRGTTVFEMPRGSMALGITATAVFSEQRIELNPADMLILYSDGITEAMNAAGEFFGDERLRGLLPGLAGLPAEGVGTALLAAVERFVAGSRPSDDVSLVVLKRTGGATAI
jgi:phosphoserine phosphatase RsbU/P